MVAVGRIQGQVPESMLFYVIGARGARKLKTRARCAPVESV